MHAILCACTNVYVAARVRICESAYLRICESARILGRACGDLCVHVCKCEDACDVCVCARTTERARANVMVCMREC